MVDKTDRAYDDLHDEWVLTMMDPPNSDKECPGCGSYGFGCYECTPTVESEEGQADG